MLNIQLRINYSNASIFNYRVNNTSQIQAPSKFPFGDLAKRGKVQNGATASRVAPLKTGDGRKGGNYLPKAVL